MKKWEQERTRRINNFTSLVYTIALFIIALVITSYYRRVGREAENLSSFLFAVYVFSFSAVIILIIYQQKLQKEKTYKKISLFEIGTFSGTILLVIYTVHLTGSFESKFKSLYLLPPIIAAIKYGRKGGLIVGALCSTSMFFDTWINYSGSNLVNLLFDSEIAYALILMLIVWLIGSMEDLERNVRQNLLYWNQHLQQTERLSIIGQMAAGTAHEIRNPLTTIKGFLQLLQLKIAQDKQYEYDEYLDIILKEIDRMNNLVSDFLVLAKPTETRLACLDLNNLFEEISSLISSEALLRGVDLYLNHSGQLPLIAGDKEKLKQVVLNLVNNSFQAMGDNGLLVITTVYSKDQKLITIMIEDNGKGISIENIDKLFTPFFTTKEAGTGLGLAISHQIIKSHRGKIRVESELGKGTKFYIDLPEYTT